MDEQLDNDAIQDVLKRFTEELLNIVRRQAVQTQQARAQEVCTVIECDFD